MSAFSPAVLLAALLATGAAAQEPPAQAPANPDSEVTVTGTLERDQEIRDFVRALTDAPITGQLARFEEAICPGVLGLSGPLKEAVVNRMRRVSAAAGLPLAGGACRPNVLLMVTRDKRALINALASRYPHFFGLEPDESPRRIASQPGPAAAWHARISVNADGRRLPMQGGFYVNQTGNLNGRIVVPTRPVFIAAAVVIEQSALPGLSVNQLADYALMRALARTDPNRLAPGSQRTILSVLEAAPDAEVPPTLTQWDMGFLRGLYASTRNLRAPQQRGEIQRHVATELNGPEGARN
jgi:hypothetical protein